MLCAFRVKASMACLQLKLLLWFHICVCLRKYIDIFKVHYNFSSFTCTFLFKAVECIVCSSFLAVYNMLSRIQHCIVDHVWSPPTCKI